MLQWLNRLFRVFMPDTPSSAPMCDLTVTTAAVPSPAPPPDHQPGEICASPLISNEGADFLSSLISTAHASGDLCRLSHDDREFISENLRRLRLNRVEIPILPGTVMRIQQLIANPDARISEIAAIFKDDPTLSAELLRLANSTYIAYLYPTLDLQQAIVRVGFTQLHGLVIMFSIRTRILQGKQYKDEVTWVTELSLAMAKVCHYLAPELGIPPEEAFTLGLMHHIEHLVIIGEACRMTSQRHGRPVSRQALAEAVHLAGPQLHSLIMQSWGMTDFNKYYQAATGEEEKSLPVTQQDRDAESLLIRLDLLQQSVINLMAGRTAELNIPGFSRDRLHSAMTVIVPDVSFAYTSQSCTTAAIDSAV